MIYRYLVCFFLPLTSLFANVVTYDFPNISSFSFHGVGKIEIAHGERNQLVMKGDESLLEMTNIKYVNQTLSIETSFPRKAYKKIPILECQLTVNQLERISLNGSVSVDIDQLNSDSLYLDLVVNGSSSIEGNIEIKHLVIAMNGNGQIELKGKVEDQTIYIKGSGVYDGRKVKANKTKMFLLGSGNGYVYSSDELTVLIEGTGNVHYMNEPKILSIDVK